MPVPGAAKRNENLIVKRLRLTICITALALPMIGVLAVWTASGDFGAMAGKLYRDLLTLDESVTVKSNGWRELYLLPFYWLLYSWPYFIFAFRLGRGHSREMSGVATMRAATRLRMFLWALPQAVFYLAVPVDYVGRGVGATYVLLLWIPFVTALLSFFYVFRTDKSP